MPIYEYQCEECSTQFDARCGFDERTEARCPSCDGRTRRLFSVVPIIFNGSGFYVTDNRKNGHGPEKTKVASGSEEKAS